MNNQSQPWAERVSACSCQGLSVCLLNICCLILFWILGPREHLSKFWSRVPEVENNRDRAWQWLVDCENTRIEHIESCTQLRYERIFVEYVNWMYLHDISPRVMYGRSCALAGLPVHAHCHNHFLVWERHCMHYACVHTFLCGMGIYVSVNGCVYVGV